MCGQEDSLPGKEGGGSNPVTDQDFRYRLRVRSQRRDGGVSGESRAAEATREETDWRWWSMVSNNVAVKKEGDWKQDFSSHS